MITMLLQNEYIEIIISIASLVIALISLIRSFKITKLDKRIKTLELEKLEEEKEMTSKPFIEARIVHVSKNNNKLVVWNSGGETAYNVEVTFDNNGPIIISSVMPFEILESGKKFEQSIMLAYSISNKYRTVTHWKDCNGKDYSKELYLTKEG